MHQQQPEHRRRPVPFGRPLLAWRPGPNSTMPKLRALFAVHSSRPQLIAAWHRGNMLDAAKAAQLWGAHPWQLIAPPADVAELVAAGQPLLEAPGK